MVKLPKNAVAALHKQALVAAAHAYAPYSNIHVGAALLANDGNIYTGCNVENASYGLTVCAERNAIANALIQITQNRATLIQAMYVVSDKLGAMPPCGACHQVISEFGKGGWIFFRTEKSIKKLKIAALLPEAFNLN
ncbi:MAG TPA: cytidine deaminase [Turneriella sp.]|nr:cytidine deaminase [Turneriella sp.]